MANTQKGSLFSRLTKLFRSGPIVRRRVRDFRQQSGSTALDVFRKAHSDVYNSTLSAYGAFDRMCIDLETKIPVPGPEKFMTLKEMIEKYPNGEEFIVYSFDHEKKEIVPAWAHHPRSSGIKDTVKITFDDGSELVCTPDHPCMLRDGTYKDAGELQLGDSMMPFYRKDFSGNKVVNESKCNHKVVSVTHYKKTYVGDLTVDGYENFATDSIVVHNSRYGDFSEMEATPEICSALDIYAEESSSSDDKGKVLHIYSENKKIQEILEELFYDILNVDFNLTMWVRNLCKYGDFFIFNDISPEYGVINAYPIPISEIEREEGFDPNDPAAVRFRWVTQGNQTLENWQVTHFRLLGNDAFLPYGSSVLESARRIWRQLIMMEDAMLVYRVIRAPERRVFYIDVGNTPPENIGEYMEAAQTALKRNQVVDKVSGKVDLRFNPLSVDEDYFMPVRGGVTGTKIDTLAGGQNTAAIEDVQYIQKKLFAALKIPKAYLGYDEDVGSKATLAQEDIRFSRAINRIQKSIVSSLNQLAQIHLFCHGFEGEDLQDFSLHLTNPSSVAQEQKLNLIKTKFEIASSAPEGVVDRRWIRKNVMGLTNDDIDAIKAGRLEDKDEDSKIEASGESESSGGASGGGSFGGGMGGSDMGSSGGLDDLGLDDESGDETGEDSGGSGEDSEESPEDLFAGDMKLGKLLVASKSKKKKEKNKEMDEADMSIDDEDAPEKAEKKLVNAFGGPIKANRKVRNGRNDLQSPNFVSMVSIGSNTRSQDTSNNPFDSDDFTGMNENSSYSDSYVQPKISRELKNMFISLSRSINSNNRKSVLTENFENEFE